MGTSGDTKLGALVAFVKARWNVAEPFLTAVSLLMAVTLGYYALFGNPFAGEPQANIWYHDAPGSEYKFDIFVGTEEGGLYEKPTIRTTNLGDGTGNGCEVSIDYQTWHVSISPTETGLRLMGDAGDSEGTVREEAASFTGGDYPPRGTRSHDLAPIIVDEPFDILTVQAWAGCENQERNLLGQDAAFTNHFSSNEQMGTAKCMLLAQRELGQIPAGQPLEANLTSDACPIEDTDPAEPSREIAAPETTAAPDPEIEAVTPTDLCTSGTRVTAAELAQEHAEYRDVLVSSFDQVVAANHELLSGCAAESTVSGRLLVTRATTTDARDALLVSHTKDEFGVALVPTMMVPVVNSLLTDDLVRVYGHRSSNFGILQTLLVRRQISQQAVEQCEIWLGSNQYADSVNPVRIPPEVAKIATPYMVSQGIVPVAVSVTDLGSADGPPKLYELTTAKLGEDGSWALVADPLEVVYKTPVRNGDGELERHTYIKGVDSGHEKRSTSACRPSDMDRLHALFDQPRDDS